MEFKEFNSLLAENFKKMSEGKELYTVDIDKDQLWNVYLDSFPAGTNNIFRMRREYDCSCCRHFVKAIGNVVAIDNGEIKTIWGFKTDDDKFQPVIDALDKFVKNHCINGIFRYYMRRVGTDHNFEIMEDGKTKQWDHFCLDLEDRFVMPNADIGSFESNAVSNKNVLKRGLDEFTTSALSDVMDMIKDNSLYRGTENRNVVQSFIDLKNEYDALADDNAKVLFCWNKSVKIGDSLCKFKNTSLGELVTNLSEGMDLETAVKKYEAMVAPENYKRSKPIYTKKMLEDAKKKILSLGYMDSLKRRMATLDDITINNIIFADRTRISKVSADSDDLFEQMEKEISVNPAKFKNAQEISIVDFLNNAAAGAGSIDLLLENRLEKNMVSLIAPEIADSKSMFKWGNNFGWAYTGNMTDSSIKKNVKNAGGNVEGVLRFSIQWNDAERSNDDLDAHCKEPSGNEIYYGNKVNRRTKGNLDVDIITPFEDVPDGDPAVENITWPDKALMDKGVYKFFVKNFTNRGGRGGFRAEIECDGVIHSYDYRKSIRSGENVQVAEVTFDGEKFTVKDILSSNLSTKKIWNLDSNQFVPVSAIMNSPNYWDEQKGTGNKHCFFMLKNCINPENPNGFYNEFLKPELNEHRRVFEALGNRTAVKDSEDQLSGVGFSYTQRNHVIVRVTDNDKKEKIYKVMF